MYGYKGITMDFPYVSIKNTSFWNIPCSLDSFYLKNGALLFYASTNYHYQKNTNIFYMQNVSFYNCSSYYGGSLVIISYQNITLKQCNFYNSSAKYHGGNMALISGEYFMLDSITLLNSNAFDASGIIINVKVLIFDNIVIDKSFSRGVGIIYLKYIQMMRINNITTSDTYAGSNGEWRLIFSI